jgi:hypothetical protein
MELSGQGDVSKPSNQDAQVKTRISAPMPSEELSRAARYRKKADELRTIAADDTNQQTRAALIQVAETYDRMAESLEMLDRSR